jgi:hypothetical protein
MRKRISTEIVFAMGMIKRKARYREESEMTHARAFRAMAQYRGQICRMYDFKIEAIIEMN